MQLMQTKVLAHVKESAHALEKILALVVVAVLLIDHAQVKVQEQEQDRARALARVKERELERSLVHVLNPIHVLQI